jgi:HEAT repeat protein
MVGVPDLKKERSPMEDEKSHDVLPGLFSALRAPDKAVRADAAKCLGGMGSPAVPGLLEALQDPDWVVRYRAVEALGMIRDSRIDPALVHALEDRRDHVRYLAAKMLGAREVKGALRPLITRLGDENEFVRISVARALALLGEPSAGQALREALGREPSRRVAGELELALSRLPPG